MPYCPFCRRKHNSRRGEHLIPKWMSLEFPNSIWQIEDRLTKYVRKSVKYIHLTTRIPCNRCNNGWMSDLERVTKPILVPLMNGISSTLTIADQVKIALWLAKTAMVYDLDAEKRAPRPRYFENDELHDFKLTRLLYPTYMYFIGAYNGSQAGIFQEDHSGFSIGNPDDLIPLSDSVRVYALTLVY